MKTLDSMKKIIALVIFSLTWQADTSAQYRLLDKSGKVRFFSEALLEDIEATNEKVLAIVDFATNKVAVSMKMKDFKFDNSLMQEHFNENYIESEKYPKATFTGSFADSIDYHQTNRIERIVSGKMTIHGVTNEVQAFVVFDVKKNVIEVSASFVLKVADYKIKIPRVVFQNIAEEVEVTADFKFIN